MSNAPDEESQPIPDRPLVRGEKVWLRPLEQRDMVAFTAGVNDTEVGGWAGYRWPQSLEQSQAWLERLQEPSRRGDVFVYAVCELGDDRFIGTIWLKEVNMMDGNAELAVFMDRDHLGGGWGTDAQRALLGFGFETLGLHRVWLTVDPSNKRAVRSYQKVGFREEGTMRHSRRGPNGLEDALLMSILREEWESGRRS